MEEMCREVSNRAHQLGRSQVGKHDFPAVQTSRDDGLAREVVLSKPYPADL